MTSLLTIVLAAGEGTRMKSKRPKLLHEVGRRSIIEHVVAAATSGGTSQMAVITSPGRPEIAQAVSSLVPEAQLYEQAETLGTAHAAKMARPLFEKATGYIAVVYGDHPLLEGETFRQITDKLDAGADAAILGFEPADPTGYGRLITQGERLLDIKEQKDATNAERAIGLCNACILGFRADVFNALIDKVGNNNAQNEYYIVDLVRLANEAGYDVTYAVADEEVVMGVNSRHHLASAEAVFQRRARQRALEAGVTMIDPDTVYFAYDTVLGHDVVIEPNVIFGPGVTIGEGAQILGFSHIEGAIVEKGAHIGPFARLRPGANIGQDAKVGNFCEVKKSDVGAGAKINHLSYIGDAEIGTKSNIGAGTITCNYDGVNKHLTKVGEGVFVGSNSALVAPVQIGDNAYIASGSVITENVPANALALGRARQVTKPDYAHSIRTRAAAIKAERQKTS